MNADAIDIVVLGRLTGESPAAWLSRNTEIVEALPDNVRVVELFGTNYIDGCHPIDSRGYRWPIKKFVAALVNAIHRAGRAVTFYVHPSMLCAALGGHDNLTKYVVAFAEIVGERFDGVYFDGIPPYGVLHEASAEWMERFKAVWSEQHGAPPLIIMHASGQWAPAAVNLMTDYAYYGEHGGPVPTWAEWDSPSWSVGDWCFIDRLGHPQYLSYTAALLRAGVTPIYKMASCHQFGLADGYPDDWPTERQLLEQSWYLGACRCWAYSPAQLRPLRDAAALRAAYATTPQQEATR